MKRIDMTRERKEALPFLLHAARAATKHVPMSTREREQLNQALEAYRDC